MSISLRRGSVLFAAACMISPLGLVTPAVAAEGDTVTILNFNDFHGRISSTGKDFACTIEAERAIASQTGTSFLFSAGDNVGATEFESFISNDTPTIDLLNTLGVDSSAVGNHEFDQGFDDLSGRISTDSNYEQLGANVYLKDTDERALDAYSIEERDGVRIAVIGVVTQETSTLVSPAGIAKVEFRDPIEEVNQVVKEIQASGDEVDLIVAEFHTGAAGNADPGVAPTGPVIEDIQNNTDSAVDAIFTAHTHMTYNYVAPKPDGSGDRPIVQTGSYGDNLGSVTFTEQADGSYTVNADEVKLVPTEDAFTNRAAECATPAMTESVQIIDDAIAVAEDKGSVKVGTQEGEITTAFDSSKASYVDGVWTANEDAYTQKGDDRSASSTISDIAAESQVWALNQDSYSGPIPDFGVMIPGSMRADLKMYDDSEGVITYKNANDVMPFANTVYTIDLTGAQVIQLLEQQWQPEGASRPYLQLGLSKNVDYTFDPTAPKGEHITGVWINGEMIDPEATYTVAGQSFLIEGGDNFSVFTEGANKKDTGLLDRDTWVNFIQNNSPLTPDYSQRGVGITDITPEGATGGTDDPLIYRITTLHSTALGAPMITEARITIDDQVFSAPYEFNEELGTYAADVKLTAECLEAGEHDALLTAIPDTGTAIDMGFVVERTGDLPETCTPDTGTDDSDNTDDQDGNDQGGNDQGDNSQGDGQGADDQGDNTDDQGSDQGTDDQGTVTVPVNNAQGPKSTGTAPQNSNMGSLPRTGAEVAPFAIGAAALVLLGGAALVARRRFTK